MEYAIKSADQFVSINMKRRVINKNKELVETMLPEENKVINKTSASIKYKKEISSEISSKCGYHKCDAIMSKYKEVNLKNYKDKEY